MLYLGRLLGGLAAGICCAVAPCFIGNNQVFILFIVYNLFKSRLALDR